MIERSVVVEPISSAVEVLPQLLCDNCGTHASGGGNDRFKNPFLRDSQELINRAVPYCPDLIGYSLISQANFVKHIGTKYDSATGEEPGELPHEEHTRFTDQKRIAYLEETSGFKVTVNSDGTREARIWASCDGGSKFRKAVNTLAKAIDLYQGTEKGMAYRKWIFSYALETYKHDRRNIDPKDKLLVAYPKVGFTNTNWKDSKDAYRSEAGDIPKPPYKYLNVNCDYYVSLRDLAEMSSVLGLNKLSDQLEREHIEGIVGINESFWSEEDQFFVPLIDGDNKKVMFFGDDALEGLEAGILLPKYARAVIPRMTQPDMLTVNGVNTRSSDSAQYHQNGPKGYHNAPWPWRNDLFKRAAQRYGFTDLATYLETVSQKVVRDHGFAELIPTKLNGESEAYVENGKEAGCNTIGFFVATRIQAEDRIVRIPVSIVAAEAASNFNYNNWPTAA